MASKLYRQISEVVVGVRKQLLFLMQSDVDLLIPEPAERLSVDWQLRTTQRRTRRVRGAEAPMLLWRGEEEKDARVSGNWKLWPLSRSRSLRAKALRGGWPRPNAKLGHVVELLQGGITATK